MGDLEAAIVAANRWFDHARPIIRAYLAMDDVGFFSKDWLEADNAERAAKKAGDTVKAATEAMRRRSYDEARSYCEKAQSQLYDMLDGIRDQYLGDASLRYVTGMSESEEDAMIAFNDELAADVISVERVVRLVEGEL